MTSYQVADKMKKCTTCHQVKELTAFPVIRKTYVSVSGEPKIYGFYRNKCKKCTSACMVKYYKLKEFNYLF